MWSSYSSSYYYYVMMLVLLLIFHCHCCVSSSSSPSLHNPISLSACSALLQFKASLSLDSYYPSCGDWSPKIRSWNESTNCCGWEGVTCDKAMGHVIGLDLSCSSLSANTTTTTSLVQLLPKTLERLNLAFNSFNGSIPSQLFTHLVSLVHLNLSHNEFYGSVPNEISLLTQLLSLDLSYNGYYPESLIFDNSAFDMYAHSNSSSSKLRYLFLDGVNMSSVPPSSLLNFTSLRRLSLVQCGLQGELPSEVFRFRYLQYLDLSGNDGITGHLPPESNWSSPIKHLDLFGCDLRGPLPASLGNLTQLTFLDLSNNFNFGGEIPNVFGSMRQLAGELRLGSSNFSGQLPSTIFNLTLITYLDLSNNRLEGGFPPHVSGLQSLKTLHLSSNLISGGLPSWLFALPSLQYLDLNNNKLNGRLPSSLFALPSLRRLDLSNNKFSGPLPSFFFDLVNLTELHLSSNNLEGVITLEMLSRPKRLESLDLSNNSLLSLRDISDHGDGVNYTIPELSFISFSSCNITEFPNSLRVANKLSSLNLSHNKIQGSISKWGSQEGWEKLADLDLSYNLLTSYSFDQFPGRNLGSVDLRSNQLQGPLLAPPPSIQKLDISQNKLTGEITPLFCNLSSIRILDLSTNNLSGIIPPCLVNTSRHFITINLKMNNIHGQIPAFESDNLQNLVLSDNQLEGRVPQSLINCTSLVYLNLANNYINDTFPHWLGMLPKLQYLFLGLNRFHGHLLENNYSMPNSSFTSLHIIDLSQNYFTGPLPTQFFQCLVANIPSFGEGDGERANERSLLILPDDDYSYVNRMKVTMKKLQIEIEEEKISPDFTLIDFSLNQFHGRIPEVVGQLVGLHVLNFSHNYLSGPIPPSLGNMQALESLDLSSNKLSGRIPPQLTNLGFLAVFNLSQNNLEGPIPTGKQFNTFDNDSYGGNPRLCGFLLSKKCGNIPELSPSSSTIAADREDGDSGIPFIWKVVMMGYGSGVVLGVSIGYIVFTTGRPQWIVGKVDGDWQYNVTKWVQRLGIGGRKRTN